MAKTDAENCRTYPHLQTDSGRLLFAFVDHRAGIRRATYLYLDCAKNVDKNWNITVSFLIHVNFDNAWAEHYPVPLKGEVGMGGPKSIQTRFVGIITYVHYTSLRLLFE